MTRKSKTNSTATILLSELQSLLAVVNLAERLTNGSREVFEDYDEIESDLRDSLRDVPAWAVP